MGKDWFPLIASGIGFCAVGTYAIATGAVVRLVARQRFSRMMIVTTQRR